MRMFFSNQGMQMDVLLRLTPVIVDPIIPIVSAYPNTTPAMVVQDH
jgi:hypothetical protein